MYQRTLTQITTERVVQGVAISLTSPIAARINESFSTQPVINGFTSIHTAVNAGSRTAIAKTPESIWDPHGITHNEQVWAVIGEMKLLDRLTGKEQPLPDGDYHYVTADMLRKLFDCCYQPLLGVKE